MSYRRQRGGSGYHGRHRGYVRNYQQQPYNSNIDKSSPSDTERYFTDISYRKRRNSHRQQKQWDVGNWNGETLIYSRSTKDDLQSKNLDDNNNISNTSQISSESNQFYRKKFKKKERRY